MTTKSSIRQAALDAGFSLVGIAAATPSQTIEFYSDWVAQGMHGPMGYLRDHIELKRDPSSLLPGAKSVIAVALNYHQPNATEPGFPRIAQYALGRDYHKVVRQRLRLVQKELQSLCPDTESRICVDSAPLLEREYAHRAGLGWFGKNTLLINTKVGSWFVLGFLLTTAELEPDEPSRGGCGTCTTCIDSCPTGAIVFGNGRWHVDARKCISTLTIETKGDFPPDTNLHGWTFGCDVCQEVCPFNQPRPHQPDRAPITTIPDFLNKKQWPSLLDLSSISEDEWDELTSGSPVRRAGQKGLQRNARAGL